MANPKIVVEIGAKVLSPEVIKAANDLQALIAKSNAPSDQKKSAEKLIDITVPKDFMKAYMRLLGINKYDLPSSALKWLI